MRHHLPGQGPDAQIGNEKGVDATGFQAAKIVRQPRQVRVMGENIDGHIDLTPQAVGKDDGLPQLVVCEIRREGPQAERFPAQIDRIGPVQQGHLQFFHTARRGEQFRFDKFTHLPLPC